MLILNFTHPITPDQHTHLATLFGGEPDIRTIPVQIDHAQPLGDQIATLVDTIGLTPAEWQTTPFIINLPGYATAAAVLIAELHGRSGNFPAILRLRPVPGSTPTTYAIAEAINLQALREQARQRR